MTNYFKLAVHFKSHNLLRANVFQTIEEDCVLHGQLHTLFNKEKREKIYHKRLENNVRELMKLLLFQQYTFLALDEVKKIKDGHFYDDIKKAAPTLYILLSKLCQNSDKTNEEKICTKIVSILITICLTKHSCLCNYLSAFMSLFFYSSDVQKHVFSLTNTLGLIESYLTSLETIDGLKEKALEHLQQRVEKRN